MSKVNKKSVVWDVFTKKEIDIHHPQQYLSFFDLQRLPEFNSVLMKEDIITFERLLYENGADIDKGYYVRDCIHRPRTSNEIYYGFRVEFSERCDSQWLASGAASEDAMYHSVDKDMLDELIALDPHKAKKKAEWMIDRELSGKFDLDIMN